MKRLWLWVVLVLCMCGLHSLAVAQQNPSHEIAYSDNGTIKMVETLSGTVTQLTYIGGYHTEPAWSPDGAQVAFTSTLTSSYYGQYGLFVMDADGGNMQQIAGDLVWRTDPLWLHDGSALIYATTGQVDGGDCIIKKVNRDGSDPREVFRQAHTECSVANLNPVLSPDGTRLAFGLDEDGDGKYAQLYSLTLESGELKRLTDNRANNAAPEWSQDGTQIAYVSNQDKQAEIYLMNADGSSPRRLTRRPANDFAPQWLPDGQEIIFASDQDGYNLYHVDVDTGVVHNLTNLTESGAWSAALSPDGTQMAYLIGLDPVAGPDGVRIMNLSSGAVFDLPAVGSAYGLMWRPG